jgi:hypothetical protein
VFTVADTGIGIPEDKHEFVMNPFTQADGSSSRCHGGTGLGLPLSAQLATMMGGEIRFHSAPGRGSRFWFSCTLRPADVGDSTPEFGAANRGSITDSEPTLHVLLSDTDEPTHNLIVQALETCGHKVSLAESVVSPLETHRKDPFDLILIDLDQADAGDPQTESLLRECNAVPDGAVPLLALTQPDVEPSNPLSGSADWTLTKPIGVAKLLDIAEEVGRRRSVATT